MLARIHSVIRFTTGGGDEGWLAPGVVDINPMHVVWIAQGHEGPGTTIMLATGAMLFTKMLPTEIKRRLEGALPR